MALKQVFSRLISLQNFAPASSLLTQTSSAASAHWSASLLPHAASAQRVALQQCRSVITVPVQNNKVPRALRKLTRTLFADRLVQEWRDREHFTKPAKRRFEAKKSTQVRLRKEEFREKLRWAMQRKARGF